MTDDEYKQLYNAMSFKGEETKQLKEMIDSWHAIVDSAKEAGMTKELFSHKAQRASSILREQAAKRKIQRQAIAVITLPTSGAAKILFPREFCCIAVRLNIDDQGRIHKEAHEAQSDHE